MTDESTPAGRQDLPEIRGRHAFTRSAGALTLLLLFIQAFSGVLLALHYRPTAEGAHASVLAIVSEAPFGWFIRGVHVWSAHLLIAVAAAWFWAKYFRRSYRSEPTPAWASAVLLIALLGAFAFSGMLLPWDEVGYHATEVGAGIAGSLPIVGGWVRSFLLAGSTSPDGATVARLFSLHAVALPFLGLLLGLYRLFGAHPAGTAERAEGGEFVRGSLLTTSMACVAAGMVLLTLVTFFPQPVGQPAEIGAAAPEGIRPAWYFLPVFMAIRLLPGSVVGIPTDALLTSGILIGTLGLFALPRLDRGGAGTFLRIAGGAVIACAVGSILMASLTI